MGDCIRRSEIVHDRTAFCVPLRLCLPARHYRELMTNALSSSIPPEIGAMTNLDRMPVVVVWLHHLW